MPESTTGDVARKRLTDAEGWGQAAALMRTAAHAAKPGLQTLAQAAPPTHSSTPTSGPSCKIATYTCPIELSSTVLFRSR
jgi:hypothetical protein